MFELMYLIQMLRLTLHYDHPHDHVGDNSVILSVTSGPDTLIQTFTITVANTNDAPTITSSEIISVDEDSEYSYILTVSDDDTSDALSMSATTLPSWLSFNPATGELTGTPLNEHVGDHLIELSATSGVDTITQTFTISVENTNDTPIANNMNVSTDEDTDLNISLNANDIDGDNLTIIIETDPVYSTIVSDGLNISVIPNQHL